MIITLYHTLSLPTGYKPRVRAPPAFREYMYPYPTPSSPSPHGELVYHRCMLRACFVDTCFPLGKPGALRKQGAACRVPVIARINDGKGKNSKERRPSFAQRPGSSSSPWAVSPKRLFPLAARQGNLKHSNSKYHLPLEDAHFVHLDLLLLVLHCSDDMTSVNRKENVSMRANNGT